ncbi:Gfo/Idh/MocA family protein [Campylobacter lari]|uniref:Oxidoreductase, Gfo/Idh/MocA family n=1 Tax=Campylobacter lari TaxID=201 RepID=A0A698FY00_CAMLA|nr:oxidoreductase, Gfo/Idh/MocA family [Campylobacter lari]AJD06575.1 oxidoreductase, Gfo/Idh/MocA family [Campylobacter lari RM16712]ECW8954025.1 oxidoreductase, Gfo/Idh/MocA family [Campylobacter lari]MBT0742273.1 oxidoreductase, Gfo/Idh/MocA family [Campylobacter lari]MBT0793471.1 oxidoreductase, Gfo/Idh/MocA family [Campylobacter lari]MCR6536185.1 oxidoreductase, Gfo/Idh/MocA family [Campylobacter lari]
MKIGLIGLGKMGKNHLRELERNLKVKEIHLYDPFCKDEFKHFLYKNFDDFLKQNLDGVIIATPTHTHLDIALKIFPKIKNVLIEKPLALNIDEILILEQKARENKVRVGVGFCERFNPAILTLKEKLLEDEIISINIQRISPYPQRINDVGVLSDLSVHDIDLVRFLSQEQILKANIYKSFHHDKFEDEVMISLKLENILASIHDSWNGQCIIRKITLLGKKHTYELDLKNFELFINTQKIPNLYENSPLYAEHEDFFELLQNGVCKILASIEDALRVQEILEGV